MTDRFKNSFASWTRDLFLLAALFFSVYKSLKINGYTDFDVYYNYGKKVYFHLTTNQNIIFAENPENTSPFRYAPIWGVFFAPFSILPHPIARALWIIFQWICYERTLDKVKKFFKLTHLQEWILILGTFRFAWDNSSIGQISCLFSLLITETAISFSNQSYKKSPLFLAIATSIKFHPIALVIIPILKKNFSYLLYFFIFLGTTLLTSYLISKEAFINYIQLTMRSTSVLSIDTIGNQSLFGALSRSIPQYSNSIFILIFLASILFCIYYWKKNKFDSILAWVLCFSMLPVFGLLTWKNTYVILIFPLAFFLKYNLRITISLCGIFMLTSQGFIGRDLNGFLLFYGALPWITWAGTLLQLYIMNATKEGMQTKM